MEEAKRVKEKHGVASPDKARSDLMINVHNIQGKAPNKCRGSRL